MVNPAKFLRRSALLAAVAALFACVAAASASAAPLAYTANFEGNSVSVINTATDQIVGQPIEVGIHPYSVAVTPNGLFVYVVNVGDDTVSVIETATHHTVGASIPVGANPFQIAISPDGKTAYVTNAASEDISVIDTQTNTVVKTIPVEGKPWGVSFTPDGKSAYVALEEDEAVEVIETQSGKPVGQIPVGDEPANIVFTPNGATAYVPNVHGESVSIINTATRKNVGSITVGEEPWGFAIAPNAAKAYVVNYGEGTVSVVDLSTNQVVGSIPIGEEPYEVGFTPDGSKAFVAEFGSEDVVAINAATNQVIGSPIDLEGLAPWQIAITPDQSPTAAYSPPAAIVNQPTEFSGIASSDPDGTISSYAWAFGDGATATGLAPKHTYSTAGEYAVKLSVVDNEGCGEAEVFTGRTAYCSGSASAAVTHMVTAYPPPNNFGFKRLIHNRNNGTVRMQVKLPGEGELVLTGPQVHMVRKKKAPAGLVWMTLHPRVEVGKRLKKVHHLRIGVQVKFTPVGGTTKTKSRSLQLLRKPKKHHHG